MASLLAWLKRELWRMKKLRELKRSATRKPELAPARTDSPRVLIGATNSAGQGFQWARALERMRPEVRAISMQFVRDASLRFPVDLAVANGFGAHSRFWQRHQTSVLKGYDAVLIESAKPVLGGRHNANVLAQISELQSAGVRVALIFHGSDIRDPIAHMREEPASYFAVDEAFTGRMAEGVQRSKAVLADAHVPVFVSTLDLLTDVPNAIWLPVVIDPLKWQTQQAPLTKPGLPRVVHVPSSSLIKGTDLIDPVMRRLHDDGVVEYECVTGVDPDNMPQMYQEADIVLDQFRGGPYGVAACEALAAGRIVISHVPHRERIRKHTGEELPIIQATHENLAQVIMHTIEEPHEALHLALQGPGFVARHHDGTRTGRILSEWLGQVNGAR